MWARGGVFSGKQRLHDVPGALRLEPHPGTDRGMAGGQALDLAACASEQDLNLAMLENIHIHKTGALIRAGVRMATLALPELSAETANHLDHYAKCLGLAFQIRDDILDVEGDTACDAISIGFVR